MDLHDDWPVIRTLFQRAQRANLHHTFCTVDDAGRPAATPIGSLMLDPAQPRGFYFDIFNQGLSANLDSRPAVAVLAVDSRKGLWLRALLTGAFPTPPALRLHGTASAGRTSTESERARWRRATRLFRPLRGYALLWSRLDRVRDVGFDRVEPVRLGRLTDRFYRGRTAGRRPR